MKVVSRAIGLGVAFALVFAAIWMFVPIKASEEPSSKAVSAVGSVSTKVFSWFSGVSGKGASDVSSTVSDLYFENLSSYSPNGAIRGMAKPVGTFYVEEYDGSSRICMATLVDTDKILTATECLLGEDGIGEVSLASFIPQGLAEDPIRYLPDDKEGNRGKKDRTELCDEDAYQGETNTRARVQQRKNIIARVWDAIECGFVGCGPEESPSTEGDIPQDEWFWCYAVNVDTENPDFEGPNSRSARSTSLSPGSLVILPIRDEYIEVEKDPRSKSTEAEESYETVKVNRRGDRIENPKLEYEDIDKVDDYESVVKVIVNKKDKVLEIHRKRKYLAKLYAPHPIPVAGFHPARPEPGEDLLVVHAGDNPSDLQLTRFGCRIERVGAAGSHFDHACSVRAPGLGAPLFDVATGGLVGVNVYSGRIVGGFNAVSSTAIPAKWRPGFHQVSQGMGPVAFGATEEKARAGLDYYVKSPAFVVKSGDDEKLRIDPQVGLIDPVQFLDDLLGVHSMFAEDSQIVVAFENDEEKGKPTASEFVFERTIRDRAECLPAFDSAASEFAGTWGPSRANARDAGNNEKGDQEATFGLSESSTAVLKLDIEEPCKLTLTIKGHGSDN